MWLIIFSKNVYPRINAPAGMMARMTSVLMASVVPQPTSSASVGMAVIGRCRRG